MKERTGSSGKKLSQCPGKHTNHKNSMTEQHSIVMIFSNKMLGKISSTVHPIAIATLQIHPKPRVRGKAPKMYQTSFMQQYKFYDMSVANYAIHENTHLQKI